MKRIFLIQCSKSKLQTKVKAIDLYTGPLYKKMLFCALRSAHDEILILSSKHHLLETNIEIDPYDDFLGNKSKRREKNGPIE